LGTCSFDLKCYSICVSVAAKRVVDKSATSVKRYFFIHFPYKLQKLICMKCKVLYNKTNHSLLIKGQ